MGRSVATHPDSVATVFVDLDDWVQTAHDWDAFLDDVLSVVRERYPSFDPVDNKWHGRETRLIAENRLASIAVSEYCGVAAIDLVPNVYVYDPNLNALAEAWCNRAAESFRSHLFKRYQGHALASCGTMSNGETVYRRIG